LGLTVTLLSTDRSHYSLGDPVTYEVLIRNEGQVPLEFPWSAEVQSFFDPPHFDPQLPDAVVNATNILIELRAIRSGLSSDLVGTTQILTPHAASDCLSTLAIRFWDARHPDEF